ncbi:hypothetical protein A3A20_00125 [Candidatus Wolfebacteria bacterium RIFCSPLOWO2_01_FULL_45_19]|uniref:Uncharacterized protein n=1 Tax=Candidatus Wolfebacteria bacterium RIFCSPLOWO2_01_FULL_45_19 TaxID=1802557 RepID=A0A1F8DQS4_9BACT|nr:MAG: hypothetical protein UX23_C0007G0035 [Parcubacteria group bacterium GW2011_GWB1_45_9]OGM90977.1 MAG: hypothetical protein A3A20_00125 [Candidatus Wolfebacteria bacterium RIFCSPLOWO2_01_FULL_45_19]
MDKLPKSYYLYLAVLAISASAYFLYKSPGAETFPASLVSPVTPATETPPTSSSPAEISTKEELSPPEIKKTTPPPKFDAFEGQEEELEKIDDLESSLLD